MDSVKFDKFCFLLKAPSKEFVIHLCDEAFMLRSSSVFPSPLIASTAQTLSLRSDAEAIQLFSSLCSFIKIVVFRGLSEPSDILALFPGDFNKNLSVLLVKIIAQKLPVWKQVASHSLTFLPQLTDFDWRVDIKASSDSLQRMSVPTCFLQMQLQEPVTRSDVVPPSTCINVELSRQTLDTMVDGLCRIRDQLSSVAAK